MDDKKKYKKKEGKRGRVHKEKNKPRNLWVVGGHQTRDREMCMNLQEHDKKKKKWAQNLEKVVYASDMI